MANDKLIARHQAEINFHDKKYSQEKSDTIYDSGFTELIFNEMISKLGSITDKRVIDFGCGTGWLTEILLQKGAEVWTFDISEEAVKQTLMVAKNLNLEDRVHADVMPAEQLTYEDNFFDIVVGVAILHHLDLRNAANEIHRVLKNGGTAYFMEPLAHNPLINFYRKRTPEIRSPDEAPLKHHDFTFFEETFSVFKHYDYYLFTLLSLFWFYIKKNDKMFTLTRNLLFKLDSIFLKAFPMLKKYCWYSILVMHK